MCDISLSNESTANSTIMGNNSIFSWDAITSLDHCDSTHQENAEGTVLDNRVDEAGTEIGNEFFYYQSSIHKLKEQVEEKKRLLYEKGRIIEFQHKQIQILHRLINELTKAIVIHKDQADASVALLISMQKHLMTANDRINQLESNKRGTMINSKQKFQDHLDNISICTTAQMRADFAIKVAEIKKMGVELPEDIKALIVNSQKMMDDANSRVNSYQKKHQKRKKKRKAQRKYLMLFQLLLT
ncbi:unnamed protein product [Ambrosiozyma monospora]|uniref:Unnamed protein product n=1 Tax=Ambrosiozyma monospora TaxID=43982 RepID=A0A9W6WF40_AMBMO|nr:unnamed protein product [Ambrosiozyma monospora]